MKIRILIIAAFVQGICLESWSSAQPTTQPQSPPEINVVIKLKLADSTVPIEGTDLSYAFADPRWQNPYVFASYNGYESMVSEVSTNQISVRAIFRARQQPEDIASAAQAQLRSILSTNPPSDDFQRSIKLRAANLKIQSLERKHEALLALESVAQVDVTKQLNQRLTMLRDMLQGLKMEEGFKQSRKRALEEGLAELQLRAKTQQSDDPMLDQLRALVKLQQDRVDRAKKLAGVSAIVTTEVSDEEIKLLEAQARLAERQANLSKAGKGELMDRLADELTMVSIDLTDTQLRRTQIEQQIAQFNPATLDEKALENLIESEPSLRPRTREDTSALQANLRKQITDAYRERFALKVQSVEVSLPQEGAETAR